jgi:hypothetical protein
MEISRFRQKFAFDVAGSPVLRPPAASAGEAAAVIAAIEQYLRDTAPAPVPATDPRPNPWKRAALAEGVARLPDFADWL